MTLKRATSEGVAVAWARTLPLPGVSTSLPDLSTWPVLAGTLRGFVTVDAIVGGARRDTGLRMPVVSFSAWAAVPDSDRPQWGAANDLIEIIREQNDASPFVPVTVTQDAKHRSARVLSVWCPGGEPRRVQDVDESRAHYVLDVAIQWAELPE